MAVAARTPFVTRVASTGGVELAVHHLAGAADTPPLLVSHATGFHAHCYVPMAERLADRFRVVGLDYRGHGDSTVEPDWAVDWAPFGDDALAVAEELAPDGGLVGFGHSMGASALLMAAQRRPGLFERLVLFEPIAHEATSPAPTRDEIRAMPIVQGALRRRDRFPSVADAVDNYRSKPPLSLMVPAALQQYVEHGFRRAADGDGIELCCSPTLEADIFVTGRDNGVWGLLPEIDVPTLVIGGRVEERQPSESTQAIAERLPRGRYLLLDDQTHFGPFSHPDVIADLVAG